MADACLLWVSFVCMAGVVAISGTKVVEAPGFGGVAIGSSVCLKVIRRGTEDLVLSVLHIKDIKAFNTSGGSGLETDKAAVDCFTSGILMECLNCEFGDVAVLTGDDPGFDVVAIKV